MAVARKSLCRALGAALLWVAAVPGWAAPVPELAEGRYRYLVPQGDDAPRVAQWTALAGVLPQWKQKARRAHYRFEPGVDGRVCDQKDCHPGFVDRYVQRVVALPEGAARQAAREQRHGGARCGDCHVPETWGDRAPVHQVHTDQRQRLGCETCHAPGVRVAVVSGPDKLLGLRDHEPRDDWPAHRMERDPQRRECARTCHVQDNQLGVERVCGECHGEGRFEVANLADPRVLVHAADRASVLPPLTSALFTVLTVGVLGALFLYIALEMVRVRREVSDE